MSILKNLVPAVVIACTTLTAPSAHALDAIVTPLMTKALPEFPGKEVLMITVEYPPGALDPIHRHDAHGFIYVLEGSIVMQVKGGKEVTLTAGQTFYEGPSDIHVVGRNASSTQRAKFLVVFVKKERAPILTVEPSA
jgi:quercetin dioxygenase-like cupin family protein